MLLVVSFKKKKKKKTRDFPGGSVAKTVLPMQGVQVRSLVRELLIKLLRVADILDDRC